MLLFSIDGRFFSSRHSQQFSRKAGYCRASTSRKIDDSVSHHLSQSKRCLMAGAIRFVSTPSNTATTITANYNFVAFQSLGRTKSLIRWSLPISHLTKTEYIVGNTMKVPINIQVAASDTPALRGWRMNFPVLST